METTESAETSSNAVLSLSTPLLSDDGQTPNNPTPISTQENAENETSKNIPFTLAATFLAFSGRSIWNDCVLPAFVYLLRGNDPVSVGLMTAIMGISQLLSSFPAGILSDRSNYRRDRVIRAGMIFGCLGIIITTIASFRESFVILGVGMSMWGIFWGVSATAVSALFSDSIEDGKRSQYFTYQLIAQTLGMSLGPIVSISVFWILGNDWTVRDCAVVMFVGQIVSVPAVLLLWFLSDDHIIQSADEESTASGECDEKRGPHNSLSEVMSHEPFEMTLEDEEPAALQYRCFCIPKNRYVPVLIVTADIISGIASGMSIRFFPIFFLDNLNMKPVMAQLMYLLSTLGIAGMSKVAQFGGSRIGRCQMTVVTKWIGVSLMVAMCVSFTRQLPQYVTCIIYVLRTIFMNSASALTKSVVMDSVPSNERGKWSAMESITFFSWSGSAFLGGMFVDAEGIISNFYITAILQFLATFPLIALFKEKEAMEHRAENVEN